MTLLVPVPHMHGPCSALQLAVINSNTKKLGECTAAVHVPRPSQTSLTACIVLMLKAQSL